MKVLILDDEKVFTSELCEYFTMSGMQAREANTVADGWTIMKSDTPHLLILDVRLPGADGLDVLKEARQLYPAMEVIVVSGHGDMDTVIRAMRLGAIDYLKKPFRRMDIQIAIERTRKFIQLSHQMKEVEEKNSLISKNLEERIERNFIGVSKSIKKVMEMAMTVARYRDTTVLITGESGTGKENIARIIHYASERQGNIFCAVNSSAITDSLLESEFFGHKKGAFTGAVSDKKGFFEAADQGTLFLDEIADMPVNLQSKVLRAIEEKKITRVGDTEERNTDFRIISATNVDLDQLVGAKHFRLDLLHRLKTMHIHIPPLRERPEDIRPLLEFFVSDFSVKFNKPLPGIDEDIVSALEQYTFPGNVRELRNMAERAIILNQGPDLDTDDFVIPRIGSQGTPPVQQGLSLADQEIEMLRKALVNSGYNQRKAAVLLGISRDALIRKMKKYGIVISKSQD